MAAKELSLTRTQNPPHGGCKELNYPAEWSDAERMHFLMAPFPPGSDLTLNNSKVKFWRSLILSSSRELKRPVFTEDELVERLKWRRMTASCLPDVIQMMEKGGDVTKLTEFVGSLDVGWLSWGVGVASKPVQWALRRYLPAKKYTREYVVTSVLKELAQAVVATHHAAVQYKSTDRVMKYPEFQELCLKVVTPESVLVVEQYLRQQHLIAKAGTEKDGEVIKFASKEDRSTPAVTDVDIGIVGIKETVKVLSEQVKSLQERKQRLKDTARRNVQQKDRRAALNCLRRAKLLESLLIKREAALDNVENILGQIQMAETDAMILQSYKSGAEALKAMRESQGLSLESAESVMMELQEAVELNEEITNVLNGDGQEVQDDDELERELEALLALQKDDVEEELSRQLTTLSLGTGTKENLTEKPEVVQPVADRGTENDRGNSRTPATRVPQPA